MKSYHKQVSWRNFEHELYIEINLELCTWYGGELPHRHADILVRLVDEALYSRVFPVAFCFSYISVLLYFGDFKSDNLELRSANYDYDYSEICSALPKLFAKSSSNPSNEGWFQTNDDNILRCLNVLRHCCTLTWCNLFIFSYKWLGQND